MSPDASTYQIRLKTFQVPVTPAKIRLPQILKAKWETVDIPKC